MDVFNHVLDRNPKCAVATWRIVADLIGNTLAPGTTADDSSHAQAAIDLDRAALSQLRGCRASRRGFTHRSRGPDLLRCHGRHV
jgi:hypothetical protein